MPKRKRSSSLIQPRRPLRNQQPRPFLDTHFGKIPPEVRERIYQQLIATSAPPLDQKPQNKDVCSKEATSTEPKSKVAEPFPRTPAFVDLKASGLSLLQTSRLIYTEAYPIFYASNSFYFANAQDLLRFLLTIGPERRQELQSIRLGSLLKPTSTLAQYEALFPIEGGRGSCLTAILHSSTLSAFNVLANCNGLCKIEFDMRHGQELLYLEVMRKFARLRGHYLRLPVDTTHWTVSSSEALLTAPMNSYTATQDREEAARFFLIRNDYRHYFDFLRHLQNGTQIGGYGSWWGIWGTKTQVEVEIVP